MIGHFFLGFGASFLGSLPIGVLNISALHIGANQGLRSAFFFSAAVALVEFIQAFLAVRFSDFIVANAWLDKVIHIGVIPVFIIVGFYFLLKQTTSGPLPQASNFKNGVFLSAINPLAIPFWVFYATYFGEQGWLIFENAFILFFILGISIGTLAALIIFANLGVLFFNYIKTFNLYINKIIGSIFLILALYQIYSVLL